MSGLREPGDGVPRSRAGAGLYVLQERVLAARWLAYEPPVEVKCPALVEATKLCWCNHQREAYPVPPNGSSCGKRSVYCHSEGMRPNAMINISAGIARSYRLKHKIVN